jgi:hypothetical protein
MNANDPHRSSGRLSRTAAGALAVVVPGSFLALTQAPASAAPLPATYSAAAHSDIVELDAALLGEELAGLAVGHSRSTVTSTSAAAGSTATSANVGGSLVGTDVVLDEESASAPPSANPGAQTLLPVPLAPVATVGVVTGDVEAAWAGINACVPATNGVRVLSDARTTLAGITLAELPVLGSLAEVTASQTRTRTFLQDDGAGGSDVVSRATTTVGDIRLLGGQVTVDVTSPVVLQARSDGSDGSADYVNPPTVVATVGGEEVTIPMNGNAEPIELPPLLDPLANLSITAYPAQDQSSDATGKATVAALLRIDLQVLDVGVLDAAEVSLAIGPMSVEATAPTGGVACGDSGPSSGSIGAPDITSPAANATVTDTTPAISGTGEIGASVTVREGSTVLCTAVVGGNGTWSCSPTTALPTGPHTVTAVQSDSDGNTSPSDSQTFTIVTDGNDPDRDGLPSGQEGALGTDPHNPDTDGDGLTDGAEVDGVTIRERFEVCGRKARTSIRVTTDPLRKDTDRDGLNDGTEVKGYTIKQRVVTRNGTFVIGKTRSDPTRKDSDRDGLKDSAERSGKANKRFHRAKSDPRTCDTDRGGISDGAEIRARSNPADVRSGPRRPLGRTSIG